MPVLPDLLERNKQYASEFTKGDLPMPPAKKVAILTCMDARLHPEKFLGLDVGDAHVIRNAGGRASDDAIRSLIISSKLLGTEEFIVIHHTDCGMLTFTSEQLRDMLKSDLDADASDIDFLAFDDLAKSVNDDVERIKSSPYFPPHITCDGFVYDVTTGKVTDVVD
ncbi:MAG TPA: carbonic anhydrase [Dehalococcoidia bacterium]|nr:carbonic anhydrase [Dehalococcoidia bacterium]